MGRWSNSSSGGTTYTMAGSQSAADIVVTYNNLSSAPWTGSALGVTTITYTPSTGQVTKATMTINTWSGMSSDSFSRACPGR